MLYFLAVKSGEKDITRNLGHDLPLEESFTNGKKCDRNVWSSEDGTLTVFYWIRANENFPPDYYVDQSPAGGLRLFLGWINDGNPLVTPLSKRSGRFQEQQAGGEYLYMELNKDGEGILTRSPTGSVQTYYAESGGRSLFSNRAALIHTVANQGKSLPSSIDPNYLAWIIATSWALDDSTLFKNVKILEQNMSVTFLRKNARISKPSGEFWYDEGLKSQYHRNRKAFWDDCYDKLISNLDHIFDHFRAPLNFPISGGKDSRLLLALLRASKGHDYVQSTFTNGPPYSGEVIAGRLVSQHLKLPHKFNDQGYSGASFNGKIWKHIFFTETEVSPLDLSAAYEKCVPGLVLRGQETGLRNVSNILENDFERIRKWFFIHFGNFNRMGLLSQSHVSRMKEYFENYLASERDVVAEINQLPTKNRIERRFLRWGGRIWSVHNTNEFSPFIFLDSSIVRHTYNAGAKARQDAEFHFEMLNRADASLLYLPHFRDSWTAYNINVKPIQHYRVDEKQLRGSQAIMYLNWDNIKKYLLRPSSREFLGDIMEWNRLERLGQGQLEVGYYQPLWQLFQCSMMADITEFTEQSIAKSELVPGFPQLKHSAAQDQSKLNASKAENYGNVLLDALTESVNAPENPVSLRTHIKRWLIKKLP